MSCGVPEKSQEVRCVRPPSPPSPTICIQVVWTLPRRPSPVEPTIPGSRRCPHSSLRGMCRPCTQHATIRARGAHEAGQAALWESQLSAGLSGKAVRSGAAEGHRMGREARRADTREEQPHGEDSAGGVAPVPENPRNRGGQQAWGSGASWGGRPGLAFPLRAEGWAGDLQAPGSLP